jgi:hypothetical protein
VISSRLIRMAPDAWLSQGIAGIGYQSNPLDVVTLEDGWRGLPLRKAEARMIMKARRQSKEQACTAFLFGDRRECEATGRTIVLATH